MSSEDCYVIISFVYSFIAVLPELKLHLVRRSHHSHRIVHFACSVTSGICTSCMRNNERQIAYLWRLEYYCFIMSGKRKKDDSESVSIMKFFKSTERNRLSSKETSDIAERSSISSATESVQINESTCSVTSSPVDDHSPRTCSGTEQTTVIATVTATPAITDVHQFLKLLTGKIETNVESWNYLLIN